MKVSELTYNLIFAACMDFVMSAVMAFFMLWVNVGFVADFPYMWAKSFGLGFVVAYPFAVLAVPPIEKLLGRFLRVRTK